MTPVFLKGLPHASISVKQQDVVPTKTVGIVLGRPAGI